MAVNKKKVQPILLKIGLSLLTVVLVGAIVFATYYFTINKSDSGYIDQLYTLKVDVDKYNDLVAEATTDIDNLSLKNTSELESIKSKISEASFGLSKISLEIQKIKPAAKYEDQFENFSKGIYNNKKIFTQTSLILKNTHSNKISDGINALSKYISDTSRYYESAKLKKAYIRLPDGILSMADKIGEYALKSFSDYENKSRDLDIFISYFKLMDNVVTDFKNSKVDLGVNFKLLTTDGTSFEDVYSKIEVKLSELAQIQSNYEAISIPSNSKIKETHLQFNDIIKRYTYYCQDFKIAISQYEEAGTDPAAQADAAFTFDDLSVKYNDLSKTYKDYLSIYNANKTKYSNIDNL